jgi:hypothetical protein
VDTHRNSTAIKRDIGEQCLSCHLSANAQAQGQTTASREKRERTDNKRENFNKSSCFVWFESSVAPQNKKPGICSSFAFFAQFRAFRVKQFFTGRGVVDAEFGAS